ncbi:MAG: DUF3298 domain-containing protein [Spirochaetales bacterium]|nr:DUF3298 domain-containing protein [Spirochaetales bacterium]
MPKCVRALSTKAVLCIICLLFVAAAELAPDSAGSPVPSHFYKRYEGTIDNKYKIILHLTRHNETLSGYYYYDTQNIPLYLGGLADNAGSIKMDESSRRGECTGHFSGKFINSTAIRGTWQTVDRKKQFPFELTESSAADYVRCTTYKLVDSRPLFEKKADSPKVEVSLFYVYPSEYQNQQILRLLQALILPQEQNNPRQTLEHMVDSYVTVYRAENSDIYEEDSEWMFMWRHSYGTSLICNDKNMFTCRFYFNDYTGGAHGMAGEGFVSFDLETGKRLAPEDIFIADYREQLGEIMDKKLRAVENIPPQAALEDRGFFVDYIEPNDNFYIALDGIGFYFNSYEIRPYAYGPTDIFLSFKEIKHLIKADSPVRRLFE